MKEYVKSNSINNNGIVELNTFIWIHIMDFAYVHVI